jgi:hypothetical protein
MLAVSGCRGSLASTVAGPEVADLVPAVTGVIVIEEPRGGLVAVHLPRQEFTTIRPPAPPQPEDRYDIPTIHTVSGPDADGRVASIEDHFFVSDESTRRHLLKTINLAGTDDSAVFTRPGDAMWATSAAGHGEIGAHLALSPRGGRVAFMSGLKAVQLPSALLQTGTVEIWDLQTKAVVGSIGSALDEGLDWFPDGGRLAYVKLVDAKEATGLMPTGFGTAFQSWPSIPAVFVRDLAQNTDTLLHVGWNPIVSSDGGFVLVSDMDGPPRMVNVSTRVSDPASWPGMAGSGAFAVIAPDRVLSWCLPTAGVETSFTTNNSPLVGPKQNLSLKLARLSSRGFQTVVPKIDPRRQVSFGLNRGPDSR